ncbi:16S rRNA (uracil(1498)-N(3))-methyltransferase [Pseudonocardia sp. N23]|uniref:16S rRNA (uracil(1498)-N(3))-methyltransferase n=1 Tax=Pseudonocardia sp. N23 TaxID=1987376 RepID=UPI000BFCE73B|nr:16S rRNA (uracil(1498)-N(3))-methyltransferase [Pseudonocardia sp. N23]GAY10354.1 ribosomal RNA small subunit methyltransferase E [Pseudonocardia sp. N23]
MGTAPLFLVDELPTGADAVLDGPEGRHAATVRRLRVGEEITLADGRGGLARAVVDTVGRDRLDLRVVSVAVLDPPTPRVVLAQALVKGERSELAVELATEAGVDEILPWRAARCVAKWEDGARGEKALARWRTTVRSAAKQARRPWVPPVGAPVSTRELAALALRFDRILVLHESATDGLAAALTPDVREVLLVVGPEGGVSDDEIAALTAAGAVAVRLGPEVLRASTAAAVALGAIGALTSRWTPHG